MGTEATTTKGSGTKPKPEKKIEKQKHENVYAALSALQGELKVLPKSAQVSFKKKNSDEKIEYKYTPLSEILSEEMLYPLLAKHGISARHEIVKDGTKDAIVAIITHETAKWVEVAKTTKVQKDGAIEEVTEKVRVLEGELRSGPIVISQGGEMKDTGAAITYARRYSLTMLLGLSTEEDKDAEIVEQSAKNAITFAYKRAKKSLDEAKTVKDVEKSVKVLEGDLKALESGKAPSLGLSKDQYTMLIAHAGVRRKQIEQGIDPSDSTDEEEEGTVDANA
jgi:hypothetical protein